MMAMNKVFFTDDQGRIDLANTDTLTSPNSNIHLVTPMYELCAKSVTTVIQSQLNRGIS
jgi:hypothetical protein